MIKNILLALCAACFVAAFAQIEIEVPLNEADLSISGQTFAVLLAGIFLGPWYGGLAIAIYLLMGAFGLPVFSGGASGTAVFFGGSSGYLLGFFISAIVVGALGDRGWRKSFWKCTLAMLIGTIIILIFGVLRLCFLMDLPNALNAGLYPFITGGIIKILLGAAATFTLEQTLTPNS